MHIRIGGRSLIIAVGRGNPNCFLATASRQPQLGEAFFCSMSKLPFAGDIEPADPTRQPASKFKKNRGLPSPVDDR